MPSCDPLTGLGDNETFEAALARARRRTEVAVVLVDVDGLDAIVDRGGHQAADRALLGLAAKLSSVLRTGDELFRVALDSFAAIVAIRDEHEAPTAAQRIVAIADQASAMTVTVGVAVPQGSESDAAVLARAAREVSAS